MKRLAAPLPMTSSEAPVGEDGGTTKTMTSWSTSGTLNLASTFVIVSFERPATHPHPHLCPGIRILNQDFCFVFAIFISSSRRETPTGKTANVESLALIGCRIAFGLHCVVAARGLVNKMVEEHMYDKGLCGGRSIHQFLKLTHI